MIDEAFPRWSRRDDDVGEFVFCEELDDLPRHVGPIEHRVEHDDVLAHPRVVEVDRGQRRLAYDSHLNAPYNLREERGANFLDRLVERKRNLDSTGWKRYGWYRCMRRAS